CSSLLLLLFRAGHEALHIRPDCPELRFACHPEAIEGEADEELAGQVGQQREAEVVLASELDAAGGKMVGRKGSKGERALDAARGRHFVSHEGPAEDTASEAGAARPQAPVDVFVAEE